MTTWTTWTILTTLTILTTWKTWTTWTTLTTLTDQRFIKKMIATFALFTWSSLVQVNSLNQQLLIKAKNICQLLRLPLSESVSISKELCVRMWRDEIKLNNRNTALGNKHRTDCNNEEAFKKHCQRHRLSSAYQSNFFRSYHRFLHKS